MVVSSKYPPEYSGSGHRCHNTYVRLKSKFPIKTKVLSSSIINNKSKEYTYDGVNIYRIAQKIIFSSDSKTGLKIFDYILKKSYGFISIFSEYLQTFIFLSKHYNWIDIIHVFGNVTVTSATISFAKITGKPIVIELVNLVEKISFFEPRIISQFWGKGYPKQAKMVAISKALETLCLEARIDQERIWCRPNPVDETSFYYKNKKNQTILESGDVENQKIVLHLAKFLPRKKQDFMIDVINLLPHNYKLILAGPIVTSGPLAERDKSYMDSIKQKIINYKIENRVDIITGFIKNPAHYMYKSNIFVLPSIWEGLGTPVLESLACGVPVVVNNIPGVFDQWVEEGVNGFICDLDPIVWSERIMKASQISNNCLRKSSEKILNQASTKVIDEKYYGHFRKILEVR